MALSVRRHPEGVDATLFTGDSLSWDPEHEDLWAEKFVCWWSWEAQLDSLERVADHRFVRVVPTHGAISPNLDADEMRARLVGLVASLRAETL